MFILLIIEVGNIYTSSVQAQNSWSVHYNGMGTFSSPRVTDLTGDGVGDIVFGAGREELLVSGEQIKQGHY